MPPRLNIAFFGASLVSAFWNDAATYYRSILHALHDRGHSVTCYEPEAFKRQEHRDIPDPDWAKVVVYPGHDERAALRVVESAAGADLVVKASGVGVYDELLETAVLALKQPTTLVAFWDVDAPATLDRLEKNSGDAFRTVIPQYDMILTHGGGEPVVKAYQRLGANGCFPIYNALDPSTHFRVQPDSKFEADLAFLGNRLPDREARVDQLFFQAANRLLRRRFLLGGSGWESKAMPPNVCCAGPVYTHEHNALNSTASMVLNINRKSMARFGFSPPTRIFAAAGAAACIITDDWAGIDLFLEPGAEIFTAKDGDEVAKLLCSISPLQARRTGEAAMKRILSEHTYAHRARQLEQILEKGGSA